MRINRGGRETEGKPLAEVECGLFAKQGETVQSGV